MRCQRCWLPSPPALPTPLVPPVLATPTPHPRSPARPFPSPTPVVPEVLGAPNRISPAPRVPSHPQHLWYQKCWAPQTSRPPNTCGTRGVGRPRARLPTPVVPEVWSWRVPESSGGRRKGLGVSRRVGERAAGGKNLEICRFWGAWGAREGATTRAEGWGERARREKPRNF